MARLGAGADQRAARLLDPGDRHRAAADRRFERPRGGDSAIEQAAALLSDAKFPVILNGAGVVLGGRHRVHRQAGRTARCTGLLGYQHNDAFPRARTRCSPGPLGYNGSKAAMELISKADVVLALGTRLNPFSTLPGYGIDYWPKDAKIIQVDINPTASA
jgi:sulfoacetaldehyde acetyltransferase